MKESDRAAIGSGIPAVELVRRAAYAIFKHASGRDGSFALVCGSGNNGADGYALALLLAEAGRECRVFPSGSHFTPECEYFRSLCAQKGIIAGEHDDFSKYDTVIDCLIGTGFHGALREDAASTIEKINSSGAFVISADINSGLDADNGRSELCVRSDLTVAIEFIKSGHLLNDAKDVIGRLAVENIGIPLCGRAYGLIGSGDVRALLGARKHNSHKGTYGYTALIGGCSSYSGAVKLANLGASALKSGCGVVKLAVPKKIAPWVAPYLLESTLFELSDDNGSFVFNEEEIDSLLSNVKAAAIGMGLGRNPDNVRLLSHVLSSYSLSLVIDADGLNALAGNVSLLDRTDCRVIITPHPAEFSRLTGVSVRDILSDPVGHAENFAREHNVTVLLKGCTSVITDGVNTYLSDAGCPGMAGGGSGDVLSGVLAGLLGFCPAGALTAASGAYISGLAGEIAQSLAGPVSMSAGDTARAIPAAIKRVLSDN